MGWDGFLKVIWQILFLDTEDTDNMDSSVKKRKSPSDPRNPCTKTLHDRL